MKKLLIDKYELAEELGITSNNARKIVNTVNRRLTDRGRYVIPCRPPKAPRSEVYKYLGYEEEEK